jgi:predicted alpha/beta superfamily hydrolase
MPARTKTSWIVVAALALSSPAAAQNLAGTWAPEVITSKRLHAVRPVYVVTPENYARSKERYPVLVLLDATDGTQFQLALANVAFLANRGAIPPLIVVGIPNGSDRTHDMTPAATGSTATRFPTAGGAPAFEAFIVDEVLPMVRTKYRALPATIFAGHSFGGLVALDMAANRPGTFVGIIAMSPSLWWNDSTAVVSYADAIARTSSTQRLFTTSGGLEPEIDRATRRFVARLDSLEHPNTALGYRNYPDDNHGLTPAPSLVDGLRFVFDLVSPDKLGIATLTRGADSAAVVRAATGAEQTYARAARTLGLPERLPESALNAIGYNALAIDLPGAAVWVFARNAALYPESANVYDSWGDGLVAKGDSVGARALYKHAVDVATRTGHPVLNESRSKLLALEQASKTAQKKP